MFRRASVHYTRTKSSVPKTSANVALVELMKSKTVCINSVFILHVLPSIRSSNGLLFTHGVACNICYFLDVRYPLTTDIMMPRAPSWLNRSTCEVSRG